MKRRLAIGGVVLAAAALTAYLVLRSGGTAGGLDATGTIEATEAALGFERPGRIAAVLVSEGDSVSTGAVLAVLDSAELVAERASILAQLASQRAVLAEMEAGSRPEEVTRARAALSSAESQLRDAARDLDRANRLFEGGAISRQGLDAADTRYEVAEAARDQARETLALVVAGPRRERVAAQRAAVEQSVAALGRVNAMLVSQKILAPFAGVVASRHREPGEIVAPGQPVVSILNRDDRWVRIYVREDRIGAVNLGLGATITSDTYPDSTYRGEVVFISPRAEFTPRAIQTSEERVKLVYGVKVQILGDSSYHLKPGIPVDVTLSDGVDPA